MFERFRIKAALRAEMIRLRETVAMPGYSQAEQLFYEPAFAVAPLMKQDKLTAEQAMVLMVTNCVVEAARNGTLDALAASDPQTFGEMRAIYTHILAKAAADPALAPHVDRPAPGDPVPFAGPYAE